MCAVDGRLGAFWGVVCVCGGVVVVPSHHAVRVSEIEQEKAGAPGMVAQS